MSGARVCTFIDKGAAAAQVQAINAHYMTHRAPAERGRMAPPDATTCYVLVEQYADGAWGHAVDDYVRALHGMVAGDARHTIDVRAERDGPLELVKFGGEARLVFGAVAQDLSASVAPALEGVGDVDQ